MKSVVSVALVATWLLQTVPASAQSPQFYRPPNSNWARVRAMSAGESIQAAYVGRRHGHQYFVAATDETLTVLTPDGLPRSARKMLIEIAESQPGFFTTTTWMELTKGAVRINPDGIWLKNHRIAGLQDFVTTVDRGDVAEVWHEVFVHRVRVAPPLGAPDPDAAAGATAGVAGGLLTYAACKGSCPSWLYVAGFVAPMVAVAVLLAHHRDHETELVYRAP